MKLPRMAWRGLLLVLHILLGIVLTPLFSRHDPVSGRRRTNPQVVSWWHSVVVRILHLEVRTTGPLPSPPALIVSNHVSWLDIIVLGSQTTTAFLSKDEVRRWPVIGWLAETAGTLFIQRGRGDAKGIGAAIAGQLQTDRLLALFPEGTTTDGSDVRPFFSRLFSASIDSGTPVVPVALRYEVDGQRDTVVPYIDDQTLLDNLRGLLQRKRSQVTVSLGPAIQPADLSRKQLADQARAFVREQLAAGNAGPTTTG